MIFSKATPMCSTKHYARQYIKRKGQSIMLFPIATSGMHYCMQHTHPMMLYKVW